MASSGALGKLRGDFELRETAAGAILVPRGEAWPEAGRLATKHLTELDFDCE